VSGPSALWVFASANEAKLREIHALLEHAAIDIAPQSDFGIASPEETASTFVENALIKARHAALASGLPALADDSGLTVEALGGAPGIRSARFAGAQADDRANVAKLLEALEQVPDEQREARFHCVIVALRDPNDPAPLISQGEWRGLITRAARGEGGFGYDPVFFDPLRHATAAELSAEEKNRVSHRGRALRGLARQLARGGPDG